MERDIDEQDKNRRIGNDERPAFRPFQPHEDDDEYRDRRDEDWKTVEEPLALAAALRAETEQGAAVLVDCLTLWLGNLLGEAREVETEIDGLVASIGQFGGPVVFVSNEVGQGIVPDNALARQFRDHAGILHQRLAEKADRVVFVTAGLPQVLK